MNSNPIARALLLTALLASGIATTGCGETTTVVTPAPAAAPATKTDITVTTPAPAAPAAPASPGK